MKWRRRRVPKTDDMRHEPPPLPALLVSTSPTLRYGSVPTVRRRADHEVETWKEPVETGITPEGRKLALGI